MDPIIAKAKAELDAVERQIANLNDKQARLKVFLATYAELTTPSAPPLHEAAKRGFMSSSAAYMGDISERVTVKSRVAGAAEIILSDQKPRHTRELIPLIEQHGAVITSKNKIQAVSAILSADDRFKASRADGWSLKNPEKARPESAATDSGHLHPLRLST